MKHSFNNLLTPSEAASILLCNERTLANWRCQEKGPKFTKMPNGRIYYPEEEVDRYLKECMNIFKANSHNSKLISWDEFQP